MTQPQILIQVTPQGQVQMQATTGDPIVIYGLLELAKDSLRDQMHQAEKGPAIVMAPAAALNQLQKAN